MRYTHIWGNLGDGSIPNITLEGWIRSPKHTRHSIVTRGIGFFSYDFAAVSVFDDFIEKTLDLEKTGEW